KACIQLRGDIDKLDFGRSFRDRLHFSPEIKIFGDLLVIGEDAAKQHRLIFLDTSAEVKDLLAIQIVKGKGVALLDFIEIGSDLGGRISSQPPRCNSRYPGRSSQPGSKGHVGSRKPRRRNEFPIEGE